MSSILPIPDISLLPDPVYLPAYLKAFTWGGKQYYGSLVIAAGPEDKIHKVILSSNAPWVRMEKLNITVPFLSVWVATVPGRHNYGSARSGQITLTLQHDHSTQVMCDVYQAAGELISVTMENLWQAPMIMEAEIAAKFIADKVKKIPPPIKYIVIAVLAIVFIVIGILMIGLRKIFFLVPDPQQWTEFVNPDTPYGALLLAINKVMPMLTFTDIIIMKQTILLTLYFLEQALK